jgi:Cu/Ag efflux pump CusA
MLHHFNRPCGAFAVALLLLAPHLAPGEEPADTPMIEVLADHPGASAEEVERQVTIPLEVSFAGMPGLKRLGSTSVFGRARLLLQFERGVKPARAREAVVDRLQGVGRLPRGVTPQLWSADSRVLCRYVLAGPRDDQGRPVYTTNDLRAVQDFIVERALRRVAGVVDADGAGGTVKRYEVVVDPARLKRFGITRRQVGDAIRRANADVGGALDGAAFVPVRAVGLFGGGRGVLAEACRKKTAREAAAYLRAEEARRLREVGDVIVVTVNRVPVRVRDVAPDLSVGVRPDRDQLGLTRGRHDEADAVGGVVWLRAGEEPLAVLRRVQAQLKDLNGREGGLLPGVRVELLTGAGTRPERAEQPVFLDLHLPADVSLAKAAAQAGKVRALLARYPEVAAVLSQVGPAEAGEPAAVPGGAECLILLNDSAKWPSPPGRDRPRTRAELLADMGEALGRLLPGVDWSFSPVGRAEVRPPFFAAPGRYGVKVFGPDLDRLDTLAGRVRQALAAIPGVDQAVAFRTMGLTNLEFRVDPEKCKRYGFRVNDVNRLIQYALDRGKVVTSMVEGEQQFDVVVRWPEWRRGERSILDMPVDVIPDMVVPAPGPGPSPVSPVGRDFARAGAARIYRENGARFVAVQFGVRGPDAAAVLAEAKKKIAEIVKKPERAEWTGR